MGRNTEYTPELGAEICEYLMDGITLNKACKAVGEVAPRTVRRWAADPQHPFAPQYARAREVGYQKMADDILDIADGEDEPGKLELTDRSRLRVDTRKWLLSKALPKLYGDKLDVQHGGEVSFKAAWAAIAERGKARSHETQPGAPAPQ